MKHTVARIADVRYTGTMAKPGPKAKDPFDRFLAKVDLSDPENCWTWTGFRQNRGQGQGMFYVGPNKYMAAHRWLYMQIVDNNLDDVDLLRTCANQGCVNPDHFIETEHPDTEEGRFLLKVDFSGECWEWTGRTLTEEFPYGQFSILRDGRWFPIGAHRWAWSHYVEELSDDDYIDHVCHHPKCVNPDHLRVVTNKENMEHRSGPQKNNTSGYLGVSPRRGRWDAKVKHFGVSYYVGSFATPDEANVAVVEARKQLFTHNDRDYL